jgi:hypothetical protein
VLISGGLRLMLQAAGVKGRNQTEEGIPMFNLKMAGLALAFTAAAVLGSCSSDRSMMDNKTQLKAQLSGAQEVPANDSRGTGQGTFTYDPANKQLAYNITYSGLKAPATAGHIHGPAAAGANAGVAVPFANAASPITGTATLTDAQAADLMAGRMYVNIHSSAHPGGEIRGQITK